MRALVALVLAGCNLFGIPSGELLVGDAAAPDGDDGGDAGGGDATIEVTLTGDGTVVSTPPGISCPGDCSATFDAGTSVSLRATPNGDLMFYGFGAPCSTIGDCTIVATTDANVGAAFGTEWSQRSTAGGLSVPLPMVFDVAGNAYLAGMFQQSLNLGTDCTANVASTGFSAYLAKLRSDGTCEWVRTFGDESGSNQQVNSNALAIRADGGLVLGGGYRGTVSFGGAMRTAVLQDAFLVAVSPTGVVGQVTTVGEAGDQQFLDIDIDATGAQYVTGNFTLGFSLGGACTAVVTPRDALVARLDAAGNCEWVKPLGVTGSTSVTFGFAVAIDRSDNANVMVLYSTDATTVDNEGQVFTPGDGNNSANDVIAIKYRAASGTKVWGTSWGSASARVDGPELAIDPATGRVAVSLHVEGAIADTGGTMHNLGTGLLLQMLAPGDTVQHVFAIDTDNQFINNVAPMQFFPNGDLAIVTMGSSTTFATAQQTVTGLQPMFFRVNDAGVAVDAGHGDGTGQGSEIHAMALDAAGQVIVNGQTNGGVEFDFGEGTFTATSGWYVKFRTPF